MCLHELRFTVKYYIYIRRGKTFENSSRPYSIFPSIRTQILTIMHRNRSTGSNIPCNTLNDADFPLDGTIIWTIFKIPKFPSKSFFFFFFVYVAFSFTFKNRFFHAVPTLQLRRVSFFCIPKVCGVNCVYFYDYLHLRCPVLIRVCLPTNTNDNITTYYS